MIYVWLTLLAAARADLGIPMPNESMQLQQLINNSERQIQEAKRLVESSKTDAKASERAAHILENLSRGLDKSIEQFKGTRTYEKALLEIQQQQAAERAKPSAPKEREKKSDEHFDRFQRESVQANQNDLADQEKLEAALQNAEPGFVPKIQTRAQLGSWQASTRTSAQLSELLGAIRELREEVRGQNKSEGFGALLKMSDAMNDRIRGGPGGQR